MATHNVKVLYSGAQSKSNPDEVPISIIGQVQNLKLVKFEEVHSKFGDLVNQKVISKGQQNMTDFQLKFLFFSIGSLRFKIWAKVLAIP